MNSAKMGQKRACLWLAVMGLIGVTSVHAADMKHLQAQSLGAAPGNQLAAKLTLECTDRLFLHIDLQGEGETSVFKNYFAVAGVRKAFCGEGNQRSAASIALLCSEFRRSVARLSERREPVWRAAVMARR